VASTAAACMLLSACAQLGCCVAIRADGDRETRYFVFGFGIVSVPQAQRTDIVATRMSALGISISSQPGMKLGIGYASSEVLAVPTGVDDVVVEATTCPSEGMLLRTRALASPITPEEKP